MTFPSQLGKVKALLSLFIFQLLALVLLILLVQKYSERIMNPSKLVKVKALLSKFAFQLFVLVLLT